MLRLLFLLLRQRLQREAAAEDVVRGVARTRRAQAWVALLVRLPVLVLVLGVAMYGLAGLWRERGAVPNASQVRAPVESATLRLRVQGVESTPLLVFLDAPGTGETKVGAGAAPTVQLTSVGNAFEPAFQVAPLAARVQVGNADPIAHNTHVFKGRHTLFNLALPVQGVPVTRVLGRAGLFEVRCDLHSWMRAALFVPANPHHAVIREAGEVVLRDIAPGRWQLHIWTRARGESVQTIDLAPDSTRTLDLAAR